VGLGASADSGGDDVQGRQRFGAIGGRAWLGFLLMGACALQAEAVRAQTSQDKHHLTATAGNQFHGDTEVDRFDGHAEAVWQGGVQGINPTYFLHKAVADGDSGVLSIFSRFSLAGGPDDQEFAQSNNASGAIIEETIDPGATTSDTVTVTATLDWGGEGVLVDGSGDIDGGSVRASLTLDGCTVSFRKRFYSSVPGESTGTECAGNATNFGSASAGLLTVTRTRDAASIGSGTRFFVTASVSGDVDPNGLLEYLDSGEYAASGQLSVEVSGAAFTYSSPTFLTVPEPGDVVLAVTALAALALLARRRR
jgi:hypothetical protein